MKKAIMFFTTMLFALTVLTPIKADDELSSQDVPQSLLDYSGENIEIGKTPYNITKMEVTKKEIIIDLQYMSEYLDIIGYLETGEEVYLNKYVTSKSSNSEIAIGDRGEIYASGQGTATITFSYDGFEETIEVSVIRSFDVDSYRRQQAKLRSISDPERQAIDARADEMTYMTWTPTKNLKAWDGSYFTANQTVTGMPYTQSTQCNKSEFLAAMNNSNFYSGNTPNYGNDCSGFVSKAWNISRINTTAFIAIIRNGTYTKVGSYNLDNPSYDDLIASYSHLERGDAVVRDGHMFLISANWGDSLVCYEQTPNKARFIIKPYDSVANGKYMPFTK